MSRILADQHNRIASSSDVVREHYRGLLSPDMVRERYRDLLALPSSPDDMPGTPGWAKLPDNYQAAAIVRIALLWIEQHTPAALAERAEVESYMDRTAEKSAAVAISLAHDWENGRPTYAELYRRRHIYTEPRPVDPEAMRRWVATGSSSTPAGTPSGQTEAEGEAAA